MLRPSSRGYNVSVKHASSLWCQAEALLSTCFLFEMVVVAGTRGSRFDTSTPMSSGVQIALSPQLLAMDAPLEAAGIHRVVLRLAASGGTPPPFVAVAVKDLRRPQVSSRSVLSLSATTFAEDVPAAD